MAGTPQTGLRALCAAAMLLAQAPSPAQVQRSGGEAQKFMQQYQQIAAEKAALQAQVTQLKTSLDAAQTELAAVKRERDAAKAHVGISPAALAQATGAKEAAERNLEQSRQRMNELVGKFREVAANLKEAEADRAKLTQDLAERRSAFDQCADDNLKLYDLSQEVLDRYEHVGLFTKVSAVEPFTRLTRTRLQNLTDEYRQRAQELHINVKKAPPPQP